MKNLLFLLITLVFMTLSVSPAEYVARYQPELDWVTIDPYLENPRLFNLQVKCIIDDGPCDVVGRWVKPRVAAALLGTCIKCTPHQNGEVNKFLSWVQENRPDLFKKAVTKYLENQGIPIPGNKTEPTAIKPVAVTLQKENEKDPGTESVDLPTTIGP